MGRSLVMAGTTPAKHAIKRVNRFLDNTGVNLEVAWGNLIATGVDGAQVIRPISTVHRPPFSHPGHRTITLANAKLPPPFPDIDAVMRLSCRDLDTLPWVKSRRNSGLNRRNWQTPLLKSETLAVPRNSDLQEVASPVQTLRDPQFLPISTVKPRPLARFHLRYLAGTTAR